MFMMLRYVLAACFIYSISAASLSLDAKDNNRNKREAEKLIHGNHQNAARVKKSDPSSPPIPTAVPESSSGVDAKATVKVNSVPVPQDVANAAIPGKDTSAPMPGNAAKTSASDEKTEGDSSQGMASLGSTADSVEKEDDETSLEKLFNSKQDEDILDNLKDVNNDDQTWRPMESEEETSGDGDGETKESAEEGEDSTGLSDMYNYFDPEKPLPREYDYFYYNPLQQSYRKKRSAERVARAVKDTDMQQTAAADNNAKRRVKRDLNLSDDDYKSLQDILRLQELEREAEEEEEATEELEREIDNRPYYANRFNGGQERRGWTREQLEDMLGGATYGAAFRPEQPVSDDEINEFLRFLYGDETEPVIDQSENAISDDWSDLVSQDQSQYKPVVFDGKPGLFVPAKRQMLSMLPGIRKRSFYPYAYQPQATWSALLPSGGERKRAARDDMYNNEYKRVYSLASYLKARQYPLGYKKK